jgi:hypothetical protein
MLFYQSTDVYQRRPESGMPETIVTPPRNSTHRFIISRIDTFSACLDTRYATETVDGRVPIVSAWIDARPEEMLITRGSGDLQRSGLRAAVSVATDEIFVSKV